MLFKRCSRGPLMYPTPPVFNLRSAAIFSAGRFIIYSIFQSDDQARVPPTPVPSSVVAPVSKASATPNQSSVARSSSVASHLA